MLDWYVFRGTSRQCDDLDCLSSPNASCAPGRRQSWDISGWVFLQWTGWASQGPVLHPVPTQGLLGPPPLQPLGPGDAGRPGTRLVEASRQMVRLTMEGLFVIADEDSLPLSRCVPRCSPVCCAGPDRMSQELPIHGRAKEMQKQRQLGAAVIIPWGSNVTCP